uniref:Uncharacterized protein n=1 Tax=Oryza barthii TaxID=65489 RepID=A0A0D3HLY4_9ORYZ
MAHVPEELALKARKLIKRFHEIQYYSDNFTLSENDGERRFAPNIGTLPKTSSVIYAPKIIGREQDKDNIVEKLLSMTSDSVATPVSILAIVGMGGLGKTTLAQLVYNDSRIQGFFDMHAWVYVSEQFDPTYITKSIISSLEKDNCGLSEVCSPHETLAKQIKQKMVLLVLDDVWNERRDCWDLLCEPMNTAKLCMIIVTTRSERVAKLVQTMPNFYSLNCLSCEESWSLFKQVAFTVDNGNTPNLQEIGMSIVKKCKGLPLAIKTLASMLRYETCEQRWKDVIESELWDLEQPRNEVLPSLELSYKNMPIYLKRCFVAISLYPKDYIFDRNQVLQLWKVLDLLQSDRHNNETEIGNRYLDELVERSFLLFLLTKVDGHYYKKYLMHDLIHDLACFLSADQFFRLDDSSTSIEIPQNARYISIQNLASSEISITPLALRAIIVLPRAEVNINNSEALFSNCEKLRALVLGEGCLDQNLPALMGRLKLLRHLKLVTSFFSHSDPCWDHVDGLRGIGHLNNLLTLPPIHLRNDRIIELRSLNKIRELRIGGLGLHLTIDGAKDARLQSKRHLQLLSLDFGDCCPDHNQQVQLLESLRPHRNLRELIIMNYEGLKYPYWLGDASFSNLTQIELGYSHIQYLPTLGDLPSLVSLHIHDMMIVERIGWEFCSHFHGVKGFPSLTQLRFNWMPKWSEWSGIVDGGFPRLRTLSICHAHSLRLDNIESFPFRSLITLELDKCCCITTIPASTSLRTLRIDRRSFDLRRSSTDGPRLNRLPSLECLTVICHDTTSILLQPQHLPSLKKLNLSCEKLQYCDGLSVLTSLSVLKPWGCPKLPIHSLIPQLQLQTLDVRCSPGYVIGQLAHTEWKHYETSVKPQLCSVHFLTSGKALGFGLFPILISDRNLSGLPMGLYNHSFKLAQANPRAADPWISSMEAMGKYRCGVPCSWSLDLGKATAHGTNAHNLFGEMSSQGEILEKLEQMKTKRRCNEKIDQILEKLDEIEANRRKSFEETTNIIKATTSIFNSASSSTPPTSPTPVLAKCSWACSNSASAYTATSASHNIDVPTPTVAMGLQVSLNHGIGTTTVTPTKCLVNCFDNDTGVNHAILEESFASTTAAATMETVVSEDKACSIFINTTDLTKVMHSRCTTISLKDNIGTIQAEVAFPFPFHTLNMIAAPKEPMLVMAEKLDSIFFIKLVMPNGCLMKCLKSDKRLLAGFPRENLGHFLGQVVWLEEGMCGMFHGLHLIPFGQVMHELALLVLLTQDPSDDKRDDLLPASKNPFTSYMMAQYFEVIESRLISDTSHLDGNNVQDTWDCKGILVILEDGTSKWRMQGIKPSASKNIISAWKNVFIPTIKSVLEGDKQFCIYKPNISTYLLCHVAMPTILGRLKTRGTIVKLVVKYEHCEEGILSWSGILSLLITRKGNSDGNDLIILIIQELQVPWDPGGLHFQNFNCHRLADKSNFKKRGLLGIEWAANGPVQPFIQAGPSKPKVKNKSNSIGSFRGGKTQKGAGRRPT